MKIAHIITRMILGGAQENTMLSVLGQAERGHEVTLITGPSTGPEGCILPLMKDSNVSIIEEPRLLRALSPGKDVASIGCLRRHLRKLSPEVVHTHSSKAGVVGRIAAWKEKIPFIIHTIHGLPYHPYQSELKNRIYIAAERYATRRCHKIACVADVMAEKALAAGVGRPEQYCTVYSGMEIEPFLRRDWDLDKLRRKWGLGRNDFVIGKVARIFELKGHEYLFDAFEKILEHHSHARLFLVGNGLWLEKFVTLAREKNFSDRVTFAGLVPRAQLPETIAAMDMVAHCSLREGLARVLPQGLLSEKPVVSFDVDGAREVIIPEKTGYLLPPKDTEGLVEAIDDIISHPEKAAEMAREGGRMCRKLFDHNAMTERLLAIYREGLEEYGAS